MDEKGRQLYSSNKNYQRIVKLMEHPDFREFYDEYLRDVSTTKSVFLFLKLYEAIETRSSVPLTPFEKIALVNEVVSDPEKRQQLCQGVQQWFVPESSELSKITFSKT
jgi:hypothetical protein